MRCFVQLRFRVRLTECVARSLCGSWLRLFSKMSLTTVHKLCGCVTCDCLYKHGTASKFELPRNSRKTHDGWRGRLAWQPEASMTAGVDGRLQIVDDQATRRTRRRRSLKESRHAQLYYTVAVNTVYDRSAANSRTHRRHYVQSVQTGGRGGRSPGSFGEDRSACRDCFRSTRSCLTDPFFLAGSRRRWRAAATATP